MLENLPAFAQFGALVNKVSGVTATNVRTLPIYTAVNVGTIVQATGRMEDNGTIVLQVYVEKSELTPSDEPPETRKPEDVTRLLSQSTVRLKAGEAVVLSSGPDGGSDAKSQTWIVLSCQTL
jgi:type II secretory pathway component GspD/PulD (secretin)